MSSGLVALITTLVTLVIAALTAVFTIVVTLVSIAVPLVMFWFIYKNLSAGNFTIVVPGAGPLVQATDPTWVKRSRCRACGQPQVRPSRNAYVYCDACGELMDWDFQACLADKRSKLPGPAYEAIVRQSGPELQRARAAADRSAYESAQKRIWEAYATACPAALSPRIGDPRYKSAIVTWQATAQTAADLDPVTAGTLAAQTTATGALQWDRSNPWAPRAEAGSFFALLDAVVAHQRACIALYEREGLMERHPDRPNGELFVKMGTSAMAQGWIPYLNPPEVDKMLAITGLKDEFTRIEPPNLKKGNCPSCGGPLEVVDAAKRVLCYACGHLAAVGGGTMACHGCGSPVDVPTDSSLFKCGACDAELRRMVWS
jgi:hypothetical protein